jgi:PEP-CTERM motif
MNMRLSMLSVAAVAAMAFAAPAQAITVELNFTANFSANAPQTTVTGQFIYEAPTLTSDITSLTSVDLTISGHTYTLSELGFSGSLFPGTDTIGTIDPALGIVDFGKDTFSLSFDLATGAGNSLGYGTSSPEGIAVSTIFSHFSVEAVPEPATWSLLVIGFLSAGVLAARRRLGRAAA